jgi:hypothetical protein
MKTTFAFACARSSGTPGFRRPKACSHITFSTLPGSSRSHGRPGIATWQHGQRHPGVGALADRLAEKARGHHTDHRDDTAPKRDGLAEHVSAPPKRRCQKS